VQLRAPNSQPGEERFRLVGDPLLESGPLPAAARRLERDRRRGGVTHEPLERGYDGGRLLGRRAGSDDRELGAAVHDAT
jgi:hypothetical protein